MTFSSKCFLCKPSSLVRLSKSGRLILVNTTFILFSWRLSGLLVHSPVFCGMLELWNKASFYLCKKSACQSLIVFSCLTWAVCAEDEVARRTSPGCARRSHAVAGVLAQPTPGGSCAKVGTEMEWVELSGTRSEHMSFRWAKTPLKLWEKTQQVFPMSSTPFHLETKLGKM